MYDELLEYELIKQIASPILDRLLDLQEEMDPEMLECPLTISLSSPEIEAAQEFGSIASPSLLMDRDFLAKLESYLQEQIDLWYKPTILQ